MKTKLYAIKTQRGYGLFQKLNKRKLLDPFNYIIYKQQIDCLDKKKIKQALYSGYILANLDAYMANVENLLEGYNGKEVSLINSNIVMGTSGSKKYLYGNCFITYLGECENPFNGDYPNYTKISLYDVHMRFIGILRMKFYINPF